MNKSEKFSKKDIAQIREHGMSAEHVEKQLEQFRTGFPAVKLIAPATPKNGILALTEEEIIRFARQYEHLQGGIRSMKFIPASGAASRMFKSLHEYLNSAADKSDNQSISPEVLRFLEGIGKLALEADLLGVLKERDQLNGNQSENPSGREIISAVLDKDGLNCGSLPKGLIPFHRYPEENRTPVAEHMIEGAAYCKNDEQVVHLHFTVSKEHIDHFIELVELLRPELEQRLEVKFQIDFSIQRSFTDTIAVDPDNRPFRNDTGALVFRPGGHGALLINLQELDAELVFIKNIDNIAPDRLKPITYQYKKALAGLLLELRQQAFYFLDLIESADDTQLDEIQRFIEDRLNHRFSHRERTLSGEEKGIALRSCLNRPIRICGMVKNEGEPGGGPFWVEDEEGGQSLQIVEGSQIDLDDEHQRKVLQLSTHFNPVDLVCSIRDRQGANYNLQDFVDPDTGFISHKSQGGRDLKALELPGLWNGSMARWNTVFVEVPEQTFTPVKTITDLLRPEHIV